MAYTFSFLFPFPCLVEISYPIHAFLALPVVMINYDNICLYCLTVFFLLSLIKVCLHSKSCVVLIAFLQAQGLNGPITTASKLAESKHRLYLIKDFRGSSRLIFAIIFILKHLLLVFGTLQLLQQYIIILLWHIFYNNLRVMAISFFNKKRRSLITLKGN